MAMVGLQPMILAIGKQMEFYLRSSIHHIGFFSFFLILLSSSFQSWHVITWPLNLYASSEAYLRPLPSPFFPRGPGNVAS